MVVLKLSFTNAIHKKSFLIHRFVFSERRWKNENRTFRCIGDLEFSVESSKVDKKHLNLSRLCEVFTNIFTIDCMPFFFWWRDDSMDILCIAEWGGTISFYTIAGRQVGRERTMNFIPLKVTYFPDGQYILVCGSNEKCLLMTHEGIQLTRVGERFSSWVWSCAIHPSSSHVVSFCFTRRKEKRYWSSFTLNWIGYRLPGWNYNLPSVILEHRARIIRRQICLSREHDRCDNSALGYKSKSANKV